jgi:hypothetical protein
MGGDGMSEMFLLIKRGLYWRPNGKGYTGLKEEAGRYTLEECSAHFPNADSPNQDGTRFIAEDDAPDYASGCCEFIKGLRSLSGSWGLSAY